jgi:hypothetical protein
MEAFRAQQIEKTLKELYERKYAYEQELAATSDPIRRTSLETTLQQHNQQIEKLEDELKKLK